MHIVQVNTRHGRGGAAQVAQTLFEAARREGHRVRFLTGWASPEVPDDVDILPCPQPPWPLASVARVVRRIEAQKRAYPSLRLLGAPLRILRKFSDDPWRMAGLERYYFPASGNYFRREGALPDVVHAHNLHGDYFDLRLLSLLSRRSRCIVTLHDAWMLSGHCAHSLDCERWLFGCGHCPDLALPPSLSRDATAWNWRRKAAIYRRSRLHIAVPSRWLEGKVRRSMLMSGATEIRFIPNGVATSVFRPGSRAEARRELGIDAAAFVVLFIGENAVKNPWKDHATMMAAMERLRQSDGGDSAPLFIVLGETSVQEGLAQAGVRNVGYLESPEELARYCRAADVYLHAAHVETCSLAILQAMACGLPVVATGVAGIPELVRSLDLGFTFSGESWPFSSPAGATGILVPRRDSEAIVRAIEVLRGDRDLGMALGANAVAFVADGYRQEQMERAYLDWYGELLQRPVGAGA